MPQQTLDHKYLFGGSVLYYTTNSCRVMARGSDFCVLPGLLIDSVTVHPPFPHMCWERTEVRCLLPLSLARGQIAGKASAAAGATVREQLAGNPAAQAGTPINLSILKKNTMYLWDLRIYGCAAGFIGIITPSNSKNRNTSNMVKIIKTTKRNSKS